MSIMLGKLYLALKEGGATDSLAAEAASEVAGYENRLTKMESDISLIKWMLGANTTLLVALVALLINLMARVR